MSKVDRIASLSRKLSIAITLLIIVMALLVTIIALLISQ